MVQLRDDPKAMSGNKLLVCLPYLTPSIGGGAMALLNLLEPLADEGFDIGVVHFQEPAGALIPPRFRRRFLPKRVGRTRYYLEYPGTILRLARIVHEENPDFILCNSYQPYWLALAARALARSRARIVTGELNNLSEMFRGAKLGRLRAWLTRRLDPLADKIVVHNRGMAGHIEDFCSVPENRLFVVPIPISAARVTLLSKEPIDHPWFAPGSPPVILNVGVLDPQKDQATLLRAFALLRGKRPLRCLIVGEGPLREALTAEARRLGVEQDVSLPGFDRNPYRYMARAAVFALSSAYEGGFGMVVAEALACGCPVASTDCPYGPSDILRQDGRPPAGLLSPVGDPAALAENMERLLDDKALRASLVSRGRERALDFEPSAIAALYARELRSLA